jgi:hypothetical protein
MPSSEAKIETPRAARYLSQFGKHATAMVGAGGHTMRTPGGDPVDRGEVRLHVASGADQVVVTFDPWGTATLRAQDGTLALRAEAADPLDLRRIREILSRDFERFGRRDQLILTWTSTDPAAVTEPDRPLPTTPPASSRPRTPLMVTIAGVLGVALVVAVHLGVGGVALAAWNWLGWTAVGGAALAAVAMVVGHAAIPVAALRMRRHLTHRDRRR